MNELRAWIIVAWVSLPTVMYGGYSLLHLINRNNPLTEFQVSGSDLDMLTPAYW